MVYLALLLSLPMEFVVSLLIKETLHDKKRNYIMSQGLASRKNYKPHQKVSNTWIGANSWT